MLYMYLYRDFQGSVSTEMLSNRYLYMPNPYFLYMGIYGSIRVVEVAKRQFPYMKGSQMSVSVLVVSNATLEGSPAQAQTLVFPHNGEVRIYSRITDGSKGRGQAWQKVTVDSLPDSPISHLPVATVITERDRELLDEGQVTNLGIKALYSLEAGQEVVTGKPHNSVVAEVIEMLVVGDSALNDYLTDKRRQNGVNIKPLSPSTPATQVISVPVETIQQTAETPQVALVSEMVTVPDPKWAQTYINRRVEGVADFDIYDYAMRSHQNILIEGGAGSGKTISVQAYASARGYRYFNLACHIGIEASHLVGRWIPTADGNFRWQDGAVTEIVRNGGVLLLNEINFMPERLSTFIFSLLDYRREIQLMENGGEVIKAHPNLLIVGDMNPNYRGTRPLNQAFADRFQVRLEFPYDKTIETKLLKNNALLEMATQLRKQHDNRELATPISTRSLVAFIENAKAFGMDFATYSYINTFAEAERGAVRLVVETHRFNIAKELGLVADTILNSLTETQESVNA